MNFPPIVRAWLMLITLAVGSGIAFGLLSFVGGCSPWVAALGGLGTGLTNVYHNLAAAPKEKVEAAREKEASKAPFAKDSP